MLDKIFINYAVGLFIILCIIIVLLINLYYITPHNYIIVKKDYMELLKNKPDLVKDIFIKSNSKFQIPFDDISDKLITFDKEVNIILSNFFKSQNIIYEKNNIIMSNNSDLQIINNTDNDLNIKMLLFAS